MAVAVAHVLAKDAVGKLPFTQFFAVRTAGGVAATFAGLVLTGDLGPFLRLPPRELALLFAIGLLVPFSVNILSFWSMRRMPLNVHAPLFRTYVVTVFLLSLLFLDENLTPLTAAAVIVTFLGVVAFSAARQPADQQKASTVPMVVCLVGSVLLAIGVVLWTELRAFATPSMIAFSGTATASVIFTIAYAVCRPASGPRPAAVSAVVSGACVFGLGNFLWITALGYSSSPAVSAVHSTSTLIIAILAYIFLRERWTRGQAIAAVTICAGVVLLFFG